MPSIVRSDSGCFRPGCVAVSFTTSVSTSFMAFRIWYSLLSRGLVLSSLMSWLGQRDGRNRTIGRRLQGMPRLGKSAAGRIGGERRVAVAGAVLGLGLQDLPSVLLRFLVPGNT